MPKLRPCASVHHTTTLHFSYNCPPYQITTLFLYKNAKTASIDKCPPYQMASFFLHYCPPFHSQHFFYTKLPKSGLSHLLNDFPNESLPKIAKYGLHSSSQPLLQQKSTQNRKIWDMAECPYGPFAFLSNIHGHRTLKAPHPV